ncbi:hypothetical protein MMC13_002161 [Lambiella insularis]|nr:hypothetical protein [Lambiella insularis]
MAEASAADDRLVPGTWPEIHGALLRSPATATPPQVVFNSPPIIVGLYGVPGSGKTFLLKQLKHFLLQVVDIHRFMLYEGAEVIAHLTQGGLSAFQNLGEQKKVELRKLAIDKIKEECSARRHHAVVAGHYMFWAEGDNAGSSVMTQNDLDTFTHIVYLDIPPETILQQCQNSPDKRRPFNSADHLREWQQTEKTALRKFCRENGILFSVVVSQLDLPRKVLKLLLNFRDKGERYNQLLAERMLNEILFDEEVLDEEGQLETMLVVDADRTLAAADTGALFWKKLHSMRGSSEKDNPLEALFASQLGYSYKAFRQAALLYEELADDENFDDICQDVASGVTMYPELVSLLRAVAEEPHVRAVIVTCGLRRIWECVLSREGLLGRLQVIGGGRFDEVCVTPEVKAVLVERLRYVRKLRVWAFGDSPLDLQMLNKAHQAIIVVGEDLQRSQSMDGVLAQAIDNGSLRGARQAVLPSTASPRLDTVRLPLVRLTDPDFIDSVLSCSKPPTHSNLRHATEKSAAKLLMTPTRDATIAGPVLREAHNHIGRYLAIEFLADLIGVETYQMTHVQKHPTEGYRLQHEKETTIVALMRGGEGMALGVNDAFPLASFVHAGYAGDVKSHHLHGQSTVLLVDSVVNSGKTVVQFVQHIRSLSATIRIVVVAGVVHRQSVCRGTLSKTLASDENLSLVALRLSENKFTGTGTTDTGNRLFNTTRLP